jgi:hypothetical protein
VKNVRQATAIAYYAIEEFLQHLGRNGEASYCFEEALAAKQTGVVVLL